MGLMRALAAAGDRAGALRHARVYEALVEQELELPADREVVALAQRLRDAPAALPSAGTGRSQSPSPPLEISSSAEVSYAPLAVELETGASRPDQVAPLPRPRGPALPILLAVGAAIALFVFVLRGARHRAPPSPTAPVYALGYIHDHRPDRSIDLARSLTDMLSTGLARAEGLSVVSTARMYELLVQGPGGRDTSETGFFAAARRAGATRVLQGSLYARPDGGLRLDLQTVDLANGRLSTAYSVSAPDVFALADSGIARLLFELGQNPPPGSVADVTTHSLTAYRFYEEGLRAFYRGDLRGAERLLAAATREDSSFAMAHFYQALSILPDEAREVFGLFQRANRLAVAAPDRERLMIQAHWANLRSLPAARAIAETLAVRYPHEVQGHLLTGLIRMQEGRYLEATNAFERVIAMDSLSLHGGAARCQACDAFDWLVGAYEQLDSLPLAERTARRWLALQPQSGTAWGRLGWVLSFEGRHEEAVAAVQNRSRFGAGESNNVEALAVIYLHGDRPAQAEELLRGLIAAGSPGRQAAAHWYLTVSLRMQGRLKEALVHARQNQAMLLELRPENTMPSGGLQEAQVLFELGRFREAADMFGAAARWRPPLAPDQFSSYPVRQTSWALTHRATVLAAMGDTAALAASIDSIQQIGAQTAYRGNQILHHHVRGLLLAARGRDDEAVAELRQAMDSPNMGFSRTNSELAKALLRLGRPREAIPWLQAALRGGIESRHLYLTRIEVHELLAQAWEAEGGPASRDSAAAHYSTVVSAWQRADPQLQPRLDASRHASARLSRSGT